MAEVRFTFKCAHCGSDDFEIPDDPKPDDVVRCNGCGVEYRYDEFHAKMVELGRKHIEDMFRDILKKPG